MPRPAWVENNPVGRIATQLACLLPVNENQIDAQKDTYYRFINHERFNWRKFVYFLALKVIAHSEDTRLKAKALIADDSISAKTGKNIELAGYHFDHKIGRSILGNCRLQLGYHNGINFYPVDVALISSSKRPSTRLRPIDKRTCSWQRRKEALDKKTNALLQMVDHRIERPKKARPHSNVRPLILRSSKRCSGRSPALP